MEGWIVPVRVWESREPKVVVGGGFRERVAGAYGGGVIERSRMGRLGSGD
jgi:hypothetical protein